jgi:molybdate transport system ATP-binding protein
VILLDFELPLAGFALRAIARLTGPFTAVMGASGSGKTSLLETVAGLRPQARGRIAVGDTFFLDSAGGIRLAPERRRVGYVPQNAGLFPHLTVIGNVRFGAHTRAMAAERALEMVEITGLAARYPTSLSGGERQRVALARAVASEPLVLLLDEPLAALDVGLRERILPYLLRIRDEGIRCLYVTHNLGEALALADDMVVLEGGRVVAHGVPTALIGAPQLARSAAGDLENVRRGRIQGHDYVGGVTWIVLVLGQRLAVPLVAERAVGADVICVIRAEDILVSADPAARLSARNVLAVRVLECMRTGVDMTIRCDEVELQSEQPWLVRLTPAAVASLDVAPGRAVWLAIKSHSIRLV